MVNQNKIESVNFLNLLDFTHNLPLIISDMKVKEAMQMQLIVQRQLHEQFEVHMIRPLVLILKSIYSENLPILLVILDSKDLTIENRRTSEETKDDV